MLIKKKKKIFFFRKKKININDLEIKPSVGGTPANDSIISIKENEKNCILPKFFKSLIVNIFLKLNTKIIEKRAKFKYIYDIILRYIILNKYSFNICDTNRSTFQL